ncbi:MULTISPECIES: aspartate aminotransferase family protein [unclassified Curtobacterium]|uniref:aspartate aminotransferase family protein n=1 Tax=unclassified Curtobacterium TaxID=257496 RepID=UPI000D92228F|nr:MULTISPECIES: aspartate aminotransferase family protein [unclassified Curtobacterium]PYY55875.1 aspartate aminotransferase family protein [Curtobacterium sp. MCSS17_011]WIE79206.1 aspartate aminotransferase family protein [Curtobacterium sp. MCSS17_016]
MPPTSTGTASILEGNSLKAEDVALLDSRTRTMVEHRRARLGPAYRLFYRRPVELVRGAGARAWDADGNEYLDLYNNVPSVGHAHPVVVDAVERQMRTLNTHTRYLHTGVLAYADDLLSTMPEPLDQVMFVCTGSEANDLALRVGRAYTGGRAWIATREAYHGNTALVSAHSPALSAAEEMDPALRIVEPPDTYRHGSSEAAGAAFLSGVAAAIAEVEASRDGFAGLIVDSSFSSDGVFTGEPGMIRAAVDLVHRHGGVLVADEVQPGFGRTGEAFWGFARHGLVPDLVTTGKPMGNGFPVAAMAARSEVLEPFASQRPYFNTFGGNPVAIAAAQAVLDVVRDEGLQERALHVGRVLRDGLRELAGTHAVIGDVRGAGQYTGVELVLHGDPAQPASTTALDLLEELRERRVLTSVCGPTNNVLKLRPPLALRETDVPRLLDALDGGLTALGV